MKAKLVFLGVLLFFFFSCEDKKDNKNNNGQSDNAYVNEWIHEQMFFYYLWNEHIPLSLPIKAYEEHPENFFESLIYKRGDAAGDRFSWIEEDYEELVNSLNGITPYDIGFEYVGYSTKEEPNIVCQVVYVKPNTPAEELGVKRGDVFTHVDDVRLTKNNWRRLFGSTPAKILFQTIDGKSYEKTIPTVANYKDNPIYLDTIYHEGANKVGYLVYNHFTGDDGDGKKLYDFQLNDVFGRFKESGITHLVLDFRYNTGGSMLTSIYLGSMFVPDFNPDNIFIKAQYNKLYEEAIIKKYGMDALNDTFRERISVERGRSAAINNIGDQLQNVYILTGPWTASASELIINNMKPYLPGKLTLIGTKTSGKNLGSITIYKKNDPRNKWGMQPIVLRYANKDDFSDFIHGIEPDILEADNYLDNKRPLGDKEEVMLKIALDKIRGVEIEQRAAAIGLPVIGSSVQQKTRTNTLNVDIEKVKLLFDD